MTDAATKTRRVAVREWTCPNHPGGPPTLPADGYEREELTLTEAYSTEFVEALARLCALRSRDGGLVAETLGVCCVGHIWKVVGYEEVEVNPYVDMLRELFTLSSTDFPKHSVLLAELSRATPPADGIRIPIIKGGDDA